MFYWICKGDKIKFVTHWRGIESKKIIILYVSIEKWKKALVVNENLVVL